MGESTLGKELTIFSVLLKKIIWGIQAVENGFEDLDCKQTHLGFAEANLYQMPPKHAWVPRMLVSAEWQVLTLRQASRMWLPVAKNS